MKKFFKRAMASFAVSLLMLTTASAYAADAPPADAPLVLLNGEAAPIRAKILEGRLYFSLRDYWVNAAKIQPEHIKWYAQSQTVSNGFDYISLREQRLRAPLIDMDMPLAEPAILADGTVYVTPAYLQASSNTRYVIFDASDDRLRLHTLDWEQNGVDLGEHWRVSPIALNEQTGLPDFAARLDAEHFPYFTYEDALFDITKQIDGEQTIFTYVMKEDASRTMLVTVQDGYVTRVQDNHALEWYRPR